MSDMAARRGYRRVSLVVGLLVTLATASVVLAQRAANDPGTTVATPGGPMAAQAGFVWNGSAWVAISR